MSKVLEESEVGEVQETCEWLITENSRATDDDDSDGGGKNLCGSSKILQVLDNQSSCGS